MHGINREGSARKAGRQRKLKVAPVTRAVRAALAASAAMLALAGSGPAIAGDCTPVTAGTIHCNGDFADTLNFSVEDLTLVVGDQAPSTIAPPPGSAGILADWAGNIGVINSADILAYADGIDAIGSGDIDLDNAGDIYVVSAGQVIGLYAYTDAGDVTLANSGDIAAYSYGDLADGIFASGGDVSVANDGSIVAMSYGWAAGIEAQGADAIDVANQGDIAVRTFGAGEAFGIYAAGPQATIDNEGTIHVRGYDQAVGLYARGDTVDVDNSGDVYAGYYDNGYSSSYATAILAMSGTEGGEVSIDNSGKLYAVSFSASSGAEARALGVGGTASVTNNGDVFVQALSTGASATGIVASADGDASTRNYGDIAAYSAGTAYGAMAIAFDGEASVANAGSIVSINSAFPYYSAYGIVSSSQNGGATADNSGDIYVYSPYIGVGIEAAGMTGASVSNSGDIAADAWVSYGIRAASGQGDVSVENTGGVHAYYSGTYAPYLAFGIHAETVGGDIDIASSGDIGSAASRQSFGIFASTTTGDIAIANEGDIASISDSDLAAPIFATNAKGDVSIDNSGTLEGTSTYGAVAGAFARATDGTASITNSGDIEATTAGTSYGMLVRGYYAEAHNSGTVAATGDRAYGAYVDGTAYGVVDNTGDITASTEDGLAAGVLAIGLYGVAVSNSGDITASAGAAGTAIGVLAQSYYDVIVENSGTISATHPDVAVAVQLYSAAGTAMLENSGTLATITSVAGSIAVLGSYGANEIHNTGDIHGAIVTFGGDDVFANGKGGTWDVANLTTDFGGGDDVIENGAGGTIHLSYGAIYLGASGAYGNSFHNAGTLRTSDIGLVDMGGSPLPLSNDGIIDFVDGSPDDLLVIAGDLGGDGAINLDLRALNGAADLLYVDGDVVDGTQQAINLSIGGVPTALKGTAAPVVKVSGNVPAGSFVGGHVLDFDASNFLDLGVTLHTASTGGVNVVSAAVDVNGLNGAGVLGASLAQGVHSLVNSAVGTRSERMGLQAPSSDGQARISPWLRVYSNSGNLSPEGSGLGAGEHFGFKQENRGREIGVDFAFGNHLSVGLLAGNADGDQWLDGGVGSAHLKQHGMGLYGTWTGSRFYVDMSHRKMDIDARLRGGSGEYDTTADASASNIEAGFTGWSAGGFAIVPQVQYTRSKVDNVGALAGSKVGMEIDGGTSERGRVGVALSRSFDAGSSFTWTPYGSLSAVREFDGKSGFTIADTFSGSTSVEGSGTLAELGVGLRKGGLSVTAGLNWADGGAVDNVRGGQLVVRYGW